MLRKLAPALVIIGLLIAGAARAAPLTFYTNEADWLAAVSRFNVAPDIGPVTGFQSFVTVQLYPDGSCCIVTTPTPATIPIDSFSSLNATFSDLGIDEGRALTFTSELYVSFPSPIFGFASLDAFGRLDDGPISLNGERFTPLFLTEGFLGVVGYITSLDFTGDPLTDEFASFNLGDIVVATGEPSALASLITGLILLASACCLVRSRTAPERYASGA
jgi:hypothetical protein